MTRNEQIDIASLDWWMNEVNQNGDAEMAFKAGAAWADAHPDSPTLNADEVIAWLVGNIIDFEDYVRAFKQDFGL